MVEYTPEINSFEDIVALGGDMGLIGKVYNCKSLNIHSDATATMETIVAVLNKGHKVLVTPDIVTDDYYAIKTFVDDIGEVCGYCLKKYVYVNIEDFILKKLVYLKEIRNAASVEDPEFKGTMSLSRSDDPNETIGYKSIALGFGTVSSGFHSVALGRDAYASGNTAFAIGSNTVAKGNSAVAVGNGPQALGTYSTAMGSYSQAKGTSSCAFGNTAKAEGFSSIALGTSANANGEHSTALGHNVTANGEESTALGSSTIANGVYSTALGYNTIANGKYSTALGKYNVTDDNNNYAVVVGGGTAGSARLNIHILDWDGNAMYTGTVESTGVILPSTTTNSSKKFKITIDDTGTLTATEVTE